MQLPSVMAAEILLLLVLWGLLSCLKGGEGPEEGAVTERLLLIGLLPLIDWRVVFAELISVGGLPTPYNYENNNIIDGQVQVVKCCITFCFQYLHSFSDFSELLL